MGEQKGEQFFQRGGNFYDNSGKKKFNWTIPSESSGSQIGSPVLPIQFWFDHFSDPID